MEAVLTKLAENSVFLALLISVWYYSIRTIERKDKELSEINDKVLQAFKEHTVVMEQMKNTISTNTAATNTLSERIYSVLTDKK